MRYKNSTQVFAAVVIATIVMFFAMLIYYDPLKLFHKPWVYEKYLQGSMREQAAGILNNWQYNSIILGTSMLENTSSKEASSTLGGKFINISSSGSDYKERSIVLEYALYKNPKIKKVIYSLDYLGWTREGHPSIGIKYWDYLYDKDILNDFKIYINKKYLNCIFSINSKKECMGHEADFDRPKAWYKTVFEAEKFGGLENWFKSNDVQIKSTFKTILKATNSIENNSMQSLEGSDLGIKKSIKYLDDYIIKFAKEYPNVEFIFILPPYSRIKMATIAQTRKSDFRIYKESLKYLAVKSDVYENFKIYAWGKEAFVDDISNYKDLGHYSNEINSWMLQSIKNSHGLLGANNIESYLSVITDKALNYDLNIIGDKIKTFLDIKKVK